MHERVKWIKIARGRFSSAAGKEQKMRSLKALEAREERGVCWRDRGKGRQWKDPCSNEEHGWRRVGSTGSWSGWAAGRIQSWWKGKLEQLLLDQITTLGKQSVTPKFSWWKGWSNMLAGQRRWHRWQIAGRGKKWPEKGWFSLPAGGREI